MGAERQVRRHSSGSGKRSPTDLWSKTHTNINSGGGQWDPPSFDANGDLYLGVSNPAPFPGAKGASLRLEPARPEPLHRLHCEARPPTGKLDLALPADPHDIDDWDLQNSPILTTANGKSVVIDAGKGGIVVAVDQDTGKLLWKTPVGIHNGHDHDGLLPPAEQKAKLKFPYVVYPGILGGVESHSPPTARNVYAAVNNLASPTRTTPNAASSSTASRRARATSSRSNQATGKIVWDHKLTKSRRTAPRALTNDVLFTTTFDGTRLGAQHARPARCSGAQAPGGDQHTGRDRGQHRDHGRARSRRARTRRPRSSPTGSLLMSIAPRSIRTHAALGALTALVVTMSACGRSSERPVKPIRTGHAPRRAARAARRKDGCERRTPDSLHRRGDCRRRAPGAADERRPRGRRARCSP